MPFGSVHGLLRCNINAGVHARGRSGRVTQRCRNSPDGKRGWRVRVTSRIGSARRIWGILKKSVCRVENWTTNEKGRLSGLAEARRICAYTGAARDGGGGDGKAIIERLCISLPYVEESLNSKVIKSFVPELRSRKCFSCFEIPMFYIYMLWRFYVRFAYPYLAMVHPKLHDLSLAIR